MCFYAVKEEEEGASSERGEESGVECGGVSVRKTGAERAAGQAAVRLVEQGSRGRGSLRPGRRGTSYAAYDGNPT